ncbi:hypothetical protein [Barnesiella intestinihominis]|uniref:hypothetical protein n=1 Tax=Barnesiella intestinihominis TaxID=487174 RepID=UPI003AABC0B2
MGKQFFMVYAEGQGAPTYKHENEHAASKEAERLAEKLGVNTTVLQAVKTVTPKDITKRVKTYADACAVLGIEPMNEAVLAKLGFTKDEIAYRKLKTIAEALNEGWQPDWANSNEYKYWPWFVYNTATAGFSCASTYYAASRTTASIGSLLCYKTRELAAYAGNQFEDIYNDFLLIKK